MSKATIESSLLTLENLIVPVARSKGHKLGPRILHEALMEHPTLLARDLIWSGPGNFENKNPHLRRHELLKRMKLTSVDDFDGLPLVHAWMLTSLDNTLRGKCRLELTQWGIIRPDQFLLLLDFVWVTPDPQMKEDIMCCAMGIATILKKESKVLADFAIWVINNIFLSEKIRLNRDVIVRHAARVVVERAYRFGYLDESLVMLARPPYSVPLEFLQLDFKYLESPREQSYPIMHDLAWYVINYSYAPFFRSLERDKPAPKAEEFLKAYEKQFDISELPPLTLAMSSAIELIRRWGLDGTFESKVEWTRATHGSKSEVFTFEEKYVWCAVHYLIGYFSDYLPHGNSWSDDEGMIKNYNELLFVQNPAEEIPPQSLGEVPIQPDYISPELAVGSIEISTDLDECKKNFYQWVHKPIELRFDDWLSIDPDKLIKVQESLTSEVWIPLFNEVDLTEESGMGGIRIISQSGLVRKEKFGGLKLYLQEKPNVIGTELKFPETGLIGDSSSATYLDPRDYIWSPWIEDSYRQRTIANSIEVETAITQLATMRSFDQERHVFVLGKKLIQMLEISDGNESLYLDSSDQAQGFGFNLNREGGLQQEIICVRKEKLTQAIEDEGKVLFWIFTVFKNLRTKSKDVLPDYHTRHAWGWLVWEEGGVFKSTLIQDYDYGR